ncbi:response regulator transcription factor [Streptomyces sp. NPDC094437]|uniref:response regulator transcription factor n=1 Tax=Streptomyces sp. NPDC094437 TaxID=3366060 RepID=UPI0037F4385D
MGVRALLIEDDQTIAEPLVEGLRHFGLVVDHVRTGTEGLRGPYGDVVLLDLGLPDVDGIDVCRGIRQTSEVPIIILSARGEEADRVLGLELGADDYLAKPFSMRELVARVRAVTRRSQRGGGAGEFGAAPDRGRPHPGQQHPDHPYPPYSDHQHPDHQHPDQRCAPPRPQQQAPAEREFGAPPREPVGAESGGYFQQPSGAGTAVPDAYDDARADPYADAYAGPYADAYAGQGRGEPRGGAVPPLVVDRRTRQVWVGEGAVALTPKEFDLLALLCEDPGAVYSRQQILDRVWDPHYEGPTKTLDVHVATLRRKLGNPAWIQTLRGVGFRLAVHTRPTPAPPAYAAPAADWSADRR